MVKIDRTALETEEWLGAMADFLRTAEAAGSDAHDQEAELLKVVASREGWSEGQLQDEIEALYGRFQYWFPRLSTYAAVILLHSLVETQLLAYADRICAARNLRLNARDLQGRGVKQARAYLLKVACLDLATDDGWRVVEDLQDLRNIIVHRRGRQGASPEHQASMRRLLKAYPDTLVLGAAFTPAEEEARVSFRFCSECLNAVELFLRRVATAAGFPDKAWSA